MSRWAQVSEPELLAALVPAQQAMNAAHREMLELVAEISTRHAGTGAGYRSDAELVHLTCRVPRSVARARLDAADDVLPQVALTGETLPAALPATAAAVAEDAIGAEHVAAIRAVLAALPAHLSAHHDGLEADLAAGRATSTPGRSAPSGSGCWSTSTPTDPHRTAPIPRAPGSPSPRRAAASSSEDGWTARPTPR